MVEELIRGLAAEAGVELPPVRVSGDDPVLPSVFRVGTAAAVAVGAATAAAAAIKGSGSRAAVDVREAAIAFLDERHFRIDGIAVDLWAPLSGDYRTADGWVRLHCNFDHHRDAVLTALGLPAGTGGDAVERACAGRTAIEVEEAVTAAGGCAAAMRDRAGWREHPQSRAVAASPLVHLTRIGESGAPRTGAPRGEGGRVLDGVRVLDLTRVIAGPVATRTLAAHGAQVLRVGSRHLPEVPGPVIGTAFGKRSCHLDLRTPAGSAALRDLVAQVDVLVQSYRPGALEALGFGPRELAGIRPGIVCVDVSAYGERGPWAGRRGFDSLVQMVSGIAHEGGDGSRPRPLPAQVLDHATGHLAAFGAMAALLRRSTEGGSWRVELSLAGTARWLDGLGRVGGAATPEPDVTGMIEEMDSAFGRLTYLRPPGTVDGVSPYWSSPPPRRGEHPPAWW
ncbi:CoA transferase [Streptosporangium sp. NPDC023825]|uniref:CoA transferase n=1 Tax=Streptosporangium sp. NPDC023825 TaxID=3154909 RepID=UPI003423F490